MTRSPGSEDARVRGSAAVGTVVASDPVHGVEGVAAVAAEQRIRPAPTGQVVLSLLALQVVVPGPAVEEALAGPSEQEVVAGLAEQQVAAGIAEQDVMTACAEDHVVTGAAADDVIPGSPDENVVVVRPGDRAVDVRGQVVVQDRPLSLGIGDRRVDRVREVDEERSRPARS